MGGKMVHDTEQTVPARAARYGMHRAARIGARYERARQIDAQRKRDADAKANSGWPWWAWALIVTVALSLVGGAVWFFVFKSTPESEEDEDEDDKPDEENQANDNSKVKRIRKAGPRLLSELEQSPKEV